MKTEIRFAMTALVAAAIAVVLSAGANAQTARQETKALTIAEGAMERVELSFDVDTFRAADPQVIKVETAGAQAVRVVGVKAGSTDLQVMGKDGSVATFSVRVVENIKAILEALKKDLAEVPEVEFHESLGRVVIRGEVNNADHWGVLNKVVARFGSAVANEATFRPVPELMLDLRQALEKGGFAVVQSSEDAQRQAGALFLSVANNNIHVTGSVFSRNDIEKIKAIIQSLRWLEVSTEAAKTGEGRVLAMLDVKVVPTLIELDVAFVGVSDKEEQQIGVNLAKAGLVTIDTTAAAFAGTIGRDRSSGFTGSYSINSGLAGALNFFSGEGPSRRRALGHLTFQNDAEDFKVFHGGGTMKVRVSNQNTTGLEDIDYGLILQVKGGLVDAESVKLDVNLELSYPVAVGSDYDLKRNRVSTTVTCPVGKTLVMGGIRDLVEQVSNEGVPVLRKIPVVSWLFAEKKHLQEDMKVLILLSPQIVLPSGLIKAPLSGQTVDTYEKSEIPVKELERQKKAGKKTDAAAPAASEATDEPVAAAPEKPQAAPEK